MEKTLKIGQKMIHVQWINYGILQENKPVLVFLHEALGSIAQWKSFPLNLCSKMQLSGLVIERSGHGNSSPLTSARTLNYLHEYAGETLELLKECLPNNKEFIFIGHSDGGSIALILGAKNIPQLKTIVTIAAHTFVEEETLAGIQPAIEAYKLGKLDGLKRIHGEKTETLFYAWCDTWLHPDFKKWDIREEIKTIPIPVLALQGVSDQYGTEKQVESIQAISDVNQGVMMQNCEHHPHLQQQNETLSLIEDWLKKWVFIPR